MSYVYNPLKSPAENLRLTLADQVEAGATAAAYVASDPVDAIAARVAANNNQLAQEGGTDLTTGTVGLEVLASEDQATALSAIGAIPASEKGAANGVATLGSTGRHVAAQVRGFQVETLDYEARVIAAGSSIDAFVLEAYDRLVVTGKRDGWFALQKLILPFCGSSLAVALAQAINTDGVTTAGTNFVPGNYTQEGGLVGTGTQFVSTGVIPTALGLSSSNLSFCCVAAGGFSNVANIIGSTPAGADSKPVWSPGDSYGLTRYDGNTYGRAADTTVRAITWSGRVGGLVACADGSIQSSGSSTPTSVNLNAEILLLRGHAPDNNPYTTTGTLHFFSVGSALTDAQALSLNRAAMDFVNAVRPQPCSAALNVVGDSNGFGLGANATRWSVLLSRRLGLREVNGSMPGRRTSDTVAIIPRLVDIQVNAVNRPSASVVILATGTNDMILTDATTNGNATVITNYQTNIGNVATAVLATGRRVVILGVPYCSSVNSTKNTAYSNAGIAAARTAGVDYADAYYLFSDIASPSTTLQGDGVHFSTLGHQMIRDQLIRVLNGIRYRRLSVDFGSIAAGAEGSVNVTVPLVSVGMSVRATPTSALPSGLVVLPPVLTTDNVELRVLNTTGGAIDPPAQYWTIEVSA
jgi:lysophospholipase L1-like esterase